MKNVSKETLIRTFVLFAALINNVLTMMGMNPLPFSEGDMYTGFSQVATVIVTLWAWWKNNSFTPAAIAADEYMKALKSEGK